MKDYCCDSFKAHATYECQSHEHPWDCPDYVIAPLNDSTWCMPIRDGGQSGIVFNHCPWCGDTLAAPKDVGSKIPDKPMLIDLDVN